MLELEVNDQVRLNDYGKYIVPSCIAPHAMVGLQGTLVYKLIGYLNYDIRFVCQMPRPAGAAPRYNHKNLLKEMKL